MNTATALKQITRGVERMVRGMPASDGAGVKLTRVIGQPRMPDLDPFLMLDEFGTDRAEDYIAGFPDHPHRGFETVTYMLEGEFEHEDSAGHRGALRAGDVQWMTAGAGIIHSEMPSQRIREQGGRVHGFQIWINLPARLKMTQPRYQEIPGDKIPRAETPDGRARVRVVAGQALGARAVIATHTPIVYQDWSIDPGADVTVPLPRDHQGLVFVFEGAVRVGDKDGGGTVVEDGHMAMLGAGDAVRFRGADKPGRLLLLSGVPLNEPVARYGPFVMNTEAEIMQAARDYQSGRMGEITRTASVG